MSVAGAINPSPAAPVPAGPTTTTRRRVDVVSERPLNPADFCSSVNSTTGNESTDLDGGDTSGGQDAASSEGSSSSTGSHYHHDHFHRFHNHPAIHYLFPRKFRSQGGVGGGGGGGSGTAVGGQGFRSGKNEGRRILGLLMALAVASVFLRVYLIGGVRVVDHARLSEFVVVRSLRDDLSMARREVAENQASSQPMRVLEKLPVSFFVISLFSLNI